MYEKRQFERRPYEKTVDYSVQVLGLRDLKRLDLRGNILNISEGGLGLKIDYPIESGHVLTFSGIDQKAGIVKWNKSFGPDSYAAGVKFI